MKEVSCFDVVSHRGSLKEIVVTAIFKIFIRGAYNFILIVYYTIRIHCHFLSTDIFIDIFEKVPINQKLPSVISQFK